VHAVLIPKHRSGLTRLSRSDASHKPLLGHLLWAAAEVARQQGLEPGYRVVINDGPLGCESRFFSFRGAAFSAVPAAPAPVARRPCLLFSPARPRNIAQTPIPQNK